MDYLPLIPPFVNADQTALYNDRSRDVWKICERPEQTNLSMREPTDSDGKKIPARQNIPVCLAECLFNADGLSSPLDGDRWVCLGQSVARPGRTLKNIDFKLSIVVFIFLLRMYGEVT